VNVAGIIIHLRRHHESEKVYNGTTEAEAKGGLSDNIERRKRSLNTRPDALQKRIIALCPM
jgi:hypothetical protein